jgi:hypothetical protein
LSGTSGTDNIHVDPDGVEAPGVAGRGHRRADSDLDTAYPVLFPEEAEQRNKRVEESGKFALHKQNDISLPTRKFLLN